MSAAHGPARASALRLRTPQLGVVLALRREIVECTTGPAAMTLTVADTGLVGALLHAPSMALTTFLTVSSRACSSLRCRVAERVRRTGHLEPFPARCFLPAFTGG